MKASSPPRSIRTSTATTCAIRSKSTSGYRGTGTPGNGKRAGNAGHPSVRAVQGETDERPNNIEQRSRGTHPRASAFHGIGSLFGLYAIVDQDIGPAVARRAVAAGDTQIEFPVADFQALTLGIPRRGKPCSGEPCCIGDGCHIGYAGTTILPL